MINTCIDLTWKTALQAANVLVFQHTGEYLSDLETIILHGAWNNYTYEQIAKAEGYTSSYLCRDVGCRLWENLSIALKVKVSKTNFRAALKREWHNYTQADLSQNRNRLAELITTENLALFEGLVALDSTFYLERSPIETICYQTILKPGSLIRIEGAKWMGKTSLVKRILEQGNLQAQKTVYLDFDSVEPKIIQDIDKLLRWLFVMVSRQLNLKNNVRHYWGKSISDRHYDFTVYFEEHILTKIKSDVVLALDNIDRLFLYEELTKKFLKLLCNWQEKGKASPCWSKLKLIVTQSSKKSASFEHDRSFLNTGTPILLEEFSFQQVKTLANFYQLGWNDSEVSRLTNEVGGHPYLVRLAMYQAKTKNITRPLA